VTLGCPDLYAAFLLPQTLARFRASYPGVEVTVRCALSAQLSEEISEGRIDIALATRMPNVHPNVGSITLLRHEPLVWLGSETGGVFRDRTLPLAMLPEGNLYREYALAALNHAGRPWRIACISESIAGMEAMALADAAVIVLAESVKVNGLRRCPTSTLCYGGANPVCCRRPIISPPISSRTSAPAWRENSDRLRAPSGEKPNAAHTGGMTHWQDGVELNSSGLTPARAWCATRGDYLLARVLLIRVTTSSH